MQAAFRTARVSGLIAAVCAGLWLGARPQAAPPQKRMSVHNRLLLNRAAVIGLAKLEILLAVAEGRTASTTARVQQIGGRVLYSTPAVGYLRVEVPIERAVPFVEHDDVEAYQISSLSRGAWYRDGPPESNATMIRGFGRVVVPGMTGTAPKRDLPPLTTERSREAGYTSEDDVGLGEWMREHPTFDGRGVTIAVMEIAQIEIAHPAFQTAKTLDGWDVPKIAGILNTIPADELDDSRVELDREVVAASRWCTVADRTFLLPRPGTYGFGMLLLNAADNLVHRFAVLRDQATDDVWVDTDGDADFQDETPIADVNDRVDVRALKLVAPRPHGSALRDGEGARARCRPHLPCALRAQHHGGERGRGQQDR